MADEINALEMMATATAAEAHRLGPLDAGQQKPAGWPWTVTTATEN